MFLSPFYYSDQSGRTEYVKKAWDWFINATVYSINALDSPLNHHHEWAVWVGKAEPPVASAKQYKSHFIYGKRKNFEANAEKRMRNMIDKHNCTSVIVSQVDADDTFAPFFTTDVVELVEGAYAKGYRGGVVGHPVTQSSDYVVRGSSGEIYGVGDEPSVLCHPLRETVHKPPFHSIGMTFFLNSPFPTIFPWRGHLDNHMKWHEFVLMGLKKSGYNIHKEILVTQFPRKNVVYWMTPLSGRFIYKELVFGIKPRETSQKVNHCLGFKIDQAIVDSIPTPTSFREICRLKGVKGRKLIERNWDALVKPKTRLARNRRIKKGKVEVLCPKFLYVVCDSRLIQDNSTHALLCR